MAVAIAAAAATPLVIARGLEPASAGIGTHEALGLPPCGWAATMGVPCPSCGMTTSFAWAMEGDLLASLIAQPMGMLLALASAMVVIGGLWAAITGAQIHRPLGDVLLRGRVGWSLLVLWLVAWAWKIWAFKAGVTP